LSERAVLIGTCGWQYPQWNHSYYPEGLPEEWQLAYYGNEYPVVLIPAAYWSQGRAAIDSWLEETEDRPQFICEWSFGLEQATPVETQTLIAALGERVEGILISLDTMPDKAQRVTMATLAKAYPVCLDWPSASADQLQTVLAQLSIAPHLSICWHGELARSSQLVHGPLAVARVPSEGQSPRHLRTLLETLLANAGERQAVLLFDGDPPDLDVVDQAEVILNLL